MLRLKQSVGVRALQIRPQGLLVVTPTSIDSFPWFVASMLAVFFLAGIGNASPFKQIPMLFEKRQAGGVTRWTAAIAAYGPSVLAGILGSATGATGSAVAFFWGLSVFFALNTVLNWWVYARRGAPC